MSWGQRPVRIGTRSASSRLRQQVNEEARRLPEPPPSDLQIAMVLHALADHTALEQARVYDRSDRFAPEGVEISWPTSTSIGRWLHAVGDDIEDAIVS